MSGAWIAGGTVAGAAISSIGGKKSGKAAGKAAEAQVKEARRQSNRAEAIGSDLMKQMMDLSAATPGELAAYSQSLNAAMNLVTQDAKLLDAINPALMEASNQALSLLQGNDAASLAPIKGQRESQRATLLRTLREQLGPGAETSSAGQKALQQFDMETTSMLGQAQQSTLAMLLGTTQNSKTQVAGNVGTLQNVGIGYGNIANRQAQAVLGAGTAKLGGVTGTGQSIVQSAGAPFVSSMLQGQGMQAIGGQIMNAGGLMGMMNASSGGGSTGFSGSTGQPGLTPFTYSSPTFGSMGGG